MDKVTAIAVTAVHTQVVLSHTISLLPQEHSQQQMASQSAVRGGVGVPSEWLQQLQYLLPSVLLYWVAHHPANRDMLTSLKSVVALAQLRGPQHTQQLPLLGLPSTQGDA